MSSSLPGTQSDTPRSPWRGSPRPAGWCWPRTCPPRSGSIINVWSVDTLMLVLPCNRRRSHTSPTPSSGSPTASLGTQNISTSLRFILFTSHRHVQHFSMQSRNCHVARKIRRSYVLLFCTLLELHDFTDHECIRDRILGPRTSFLTSHLLL